MQKYSSANTSINSKKVPAIFHKVQWRKNDLNLDYGGGKYDTASEYLKTQGAVNFVYDPYNRSAVHNNKVYDLLEYFTTCTISNVLNVIKEKEVRIAILKKLSFKLKPGTPVFITVYEGDKSGIGKETKKDCYQTNMRLKDYVPEVQEAFSSVEIQNGMIIAKRI